MRDEGSRPAGLTEPPGIAAARFHRGRIATGAILFLLFTVGVYWYQVRLVGAGAEIPRIDRIRWGYLVPILLLVPMETLLAGVRMRMICRVLQPEVSLRTCLKAELTNAGMAILTPSQTGGGVAQMYMLNRGGARMGTALTISLLSFFGTMAALAGMGIFTLLVSGPGKIGALFTGAVFSLTLIATLVLLSVSWPGIFRWMVSGVSRMYWRARGSKNPLEGWLPEGGPGTQPLQDRMGPLALRLVEILYRYRDDLRTFLRRGKAVFLLACLLSAAFFLSRFFIALFCVRLLGVDTSSAGEILVLQMALLFLTYFGPTPGSSGIAEGASFSIMSGVLPVGYLPVYNLLWRGFSVYIAAFTGMTILAGAVYRDTRMKVWRRSRRPEGDRAVSRPSGSGSPG